MVNRRVKSDPQDQTPRGRPATTPEARENQLIAAAVDLAERQLRDGTASAQVISHYLKLGSSRERLEQQRLELENEFLEQKTETLRAAARVEELYKSALDAMRSYAGQAPIESGDTDDYQDVF